MARKRGPTPSPPALHLVTGTHRPDRHGLADAVATAKGAFGEPVMPEHFEGDARQAWERYIAPAWWLDRSRELAAIILCELWAELRSDPGSFPAAKHTQLRAYLERGFARALATQRRQAKETPIQ